MSQLDDLIAQFCPNGVPFEPLRDLGVWYGGGTPSKSRRDYWDHGTVAWLSPKDMGKQIVDATEDYITESAVKGSATKLVPANSVAVVVRSSILDKVLPIALIPIQITLNQDMKAIAPRNNVSSGYAAHLLRSLGPTLLRATRKVGGSVASLEVPRLMEFRVPVPPLEVQHEIVRILDLFQSLEAELEAELEKRRQQYAYYRDQLLTFPEAEVRRIPLGELADFKYGFTASAAESGDYRFLRITDITPWGKLSPEGAKYVERSAGADDYLVQPGDLLMARTGATYGKTMLVSSSEPAVYASFLIRIRFKQPNVFPAYYWHFAQSTLYWSQANAMVSTGGQPQFNANVLRLIEVPVPSLPEQARIVGILDKFDALVNDLSVGLPAELAARRKQYAYYRDRLLTFKELAE